MLTRLCLVMLVEDVGAQFEAMKIYTKYCSNHSSALKNLNKMIESLPEFAKLVDVR